MKDIVNTLAAKFQQEHQKARRYVAMMLVLAMVTTLFVNWQLHSEGIAATADYQCGEVEHTHTAECYEKVLVCGYTEGEPEDWNATMPDDDMLIDDAFGVAADDDFGTEEVSEEPEYIFVPHEHTDDCYQEVQVLDCYEEEHEHTDDCFDPEDNTLICDLFEHTHDDSCYRTEYELVCGLEEGELVEELNPDYDPVALFEEPAGLRPVVIDPVTIDPVDEAPVHYHTDDCYEEVLVCPLEEHHHTVNCLADALADVEDEADWLAKTDTTLTGMWPEDLVTVAQSQLGYQESEKNFQLDTDDGKTVRHYTRYGEWYGNPYGEWDVMFLSYCLNYADVPQRIVPQRAGTLALRSDLRGSEWLKDAADAEIQPGDIVFYDTLVTQTVAVEDETLEIEDNSTDSGIALLSLQPLETEPKTEERTVSVETVGIVSDVDEMTGSLTVISGAVDGKVAEVSLRADEVSSVVDLAAAYAQESLIDEPDEPSQDADSDFVVSDDEDFSVTLRWTSDPPEEKAMFATLETSAPISLNDYISKVVFEKLEGNDWTAIGSNEKVNDGDQIRIKANFAFAAGVLSAANNQVTYQLPGGLTLKTAITNGVIKDNEDKSVGTYTINTNGLVTMTFDDTSTSIGAALDGLLMFTATADFSGATDGKVTIGKDYTLNIKKPDPDLSIKKGLISNASTGTSIWSDDEGNYYVQWQTTVSSTKGTDGKTVTIRDDLNYGDSSNRVIASFDKDSIVLKKVTSSGTETLNYENYTWEIDNTSQKKYIEISDLPALKAGEQYLLQYVTKIPPEAFNKKTTDPNDDTRDQNKMLYNMASAKAGDLSVKLPSAAQITFQDKRIEKVYEIQSDGLVKWTITVRAPKDAAGGYLKGYKIKDTIPDNLRLEGDITIQPTPGTTKTTITKEQLEAGYPLSEVSETAHTFTITYFTTPPVGGGSATNKAELTNGDKTYTDSKTITVGVGTWSVDKQFVQFKDGKAYWNVSAANTAGSSNFTLEDEIKNPVDKNGDEVSGNDLHYAVLSELQEAIEANLQLYRASSSTPLSYTDAQKYLTIHYYDADGVKVTDSAAHVKRFTITVNTGADEAVLRIVLNNIPTHEGRDAMQDGEEWRFPNTASVNGVSKTAENIYQYHEKEFEKMVAVDGTRDNYLQDGDSVKYEDVVNQTLLYRIVLVASAGSDGKISFSDTLPEGTTWKTGDALNVLKVDGVKRAWSGGNWSLQTSTTSDGRTVLKVAVSGCNDGQEHTIEFLYQVTIDGDPKWQLPITSDVTYTNKASWNGKDVSVSTTVTRDLPPLDKKGEQLKESNGDWSNRVKYSVIINPKGDQKLGDGTWVTLKDKVTVTSGAGFYGDISSVKLYYYEYGKAVENLQEVPTNLYYREDPEDGYWLKLRVPDKTALLLEYVCEIDPGSSASPSMTNVITLNDTTSGSSTENTTFYTNSSSAVISRGQLVINKMDSQNNSRLLPNAKFDVECYNTNTKQFEPYTNGVTNENGQMVIGITQDANGTLRPNVLYRIVETDAPKNYIKDSTPHYLLFYTADGNKDAAYQAATGSDDALALADGTTVSKDDVTAGSATSTTTLNIKNTYNQLTVQKYWFDITNNTPLQDAPVDSIEVQLKRYVEGDPKETAKVVEGTTVKLNADNSWSYTWTGDAITSTDENGKKYCYIVEEVTTGNWILTDDNNNGVQNGTIVLKNYVYSGYELPSTGGMGTTPFTMLGAAAMAGAALLLIKRRKQEQKGE